MKPLMIAILLVTTLLTNAQTPDKDLSWYIHNTPFPMQEPLRPQIPDHLFNIIDHGAKGDGITDNTTVFGKVITAAAQAGGGKIIIPGGVWLTGPIRLQSNIELHLLAGALILFAPYGGKNYTTQPPLYGADLDNIAITGDGIIDGGGESWRPVKKEKMTASQWKNLLASGGTLNKEETIWWPARELAENDNLRPVLCQLKNCKRVLIQGITMRNSPKFVFYPGHCTDLTMDHVTIFNEWWAQNGDGIDISSCSRVAIYKCTVSAGDDGICMKSSGSSPLSDIVIAGCTVYHGHGGFVIGSNTDGGIHNISVSDCSFVGTDVGLRFKSSMGRGGLVEKIFIKNINMRDIVNDAILFDTYYENVPAGSSKDTTKPRPTTNIPEFRDFYISNIYCNGAHTAIHMTGLPQMPVHNISFDSITVAADRGLIATQAKQIDLQHIKLIVKQGPLYDTDSSVELKIH